VVEVVGGVEARRGHVSLAVQGGGADEGVGGRLGDEARIERGAGWVGGGQREGVTAAQPASHGG